MITLTREEAQQVMNALAFAEGEMNCEYGVTETLRAKLSALEPETKKYTEEICPVCGYYCLGKGGVNCIDKPKLCGIDTAPPHHDEPEPVAWMYEYGTDRGDAVNEIRWYPNVSLTKPIHGLVRNVVPLYTRP